MHSTTHFRFRREYLFSSFSTTLVFSFHPYTSTVRLFLTHQLSNNQKLRAIQHKTRENQRIFPRHHMTLALSLRVRMYCYCSVQYRRTKYSVNTSASRYTTQNLGRAFQTFLSLNCFNVLAIFCLMVVSLIALYSTSKTSAIGLS